VLRELVDRMLLTILCRLDATLGDYLEFKEPTLPKPDCSKFETKMWEIEYAKYIKDKDRLEGDKGKVFGLMLGQMSESSKTRLKETDNGSIAMENQDLRLLLSAILATHLTDNRSGAEHNLYKIEQAFAKYVMEPGDTLQYYHQRFRAYLSGVQEAYGRAQIECPETVYRDIQLALKFTMGLNSSYAAYKQYYEDGLKDWPENLSDALTEAAKYKPRTAGSVNPNDMGRANAFAMRGRGRGRGRGRQSGRGYSSDNRGGSYGDTSGTHTGGQSDYGTRKGDCHTCGEHGHYSFECRAKDTQGGQKMGAGGAQLEPSNHGKGK
jgi:hypothetical protein